MNCNKIQEIILTDYIDGRLAGPVKTELESHLKSCAVCREFLSVAQKSLVEPFEDLPRERMPQSVMDAVMEEVREQEAARESGWFPGFIEGLREYFSPSFPVARFASVLLVCSLAAGVLSGVGRSQQAQKEERGLYLSEVSDMASGKSKIATDYGTGMEMYFLNDKEDS